MTRTLPGADSAVFLDDAAGMAWRRLALQLHHEMPRGETPRSVMITSANTAAGAARAAVMLAHALAGELQRPVRLVDAHPRVGDITRLLGCAGARGFCELTIDAALRPEDVALPTSDPLVTFVPCGLATHRTHATEAVARVVREATQGIDFVVLHGGPVLDDTMALSLAPFVGCVLTLAVENRTLLQDLDLAQRSIRFCKPPRIGLVIASDDHER